MSEVMEVLSAGELRERNRIMLFKLVLIVPAMLLFCASMVPLYRQICEVMGVTATRASTRMLQISATAGGWGRERL